MKNKITELERFEKFIFYSPDGCWYWTGASGRYGNFRTSKTKQTPAHRKSYELYKGVINDNLCVMHICDNTLCVNPDHLKLGTIADNNYDRKIKGRNRNQNGINHNNVKLNDLDITIIKECRSNGFKLKDIANYFGVSFGHVSAISLNKRWKHDLSIKN